MPAPVSSERRIARATLLQIGGRVASGLATLAGLGVAFRALGAPAFGRYAFYLAAFAILESAVDLGTMDATVRRTARDSAAGAGAARAAVRHRLGRAAGGVGAIAALALVGGERAPAAFALAATTLLGHALAPLAAPLHASLAYGTLVACRAAGALATLAATVFLARARVDHPAAYLAASGGGAALANFLAARLAARRFPRARDSSSEPAPEGFTRESASLGLGALLRQGYAQLDPFFLRPLAGETAVAHFQAPYRLFLVAVTLPGYACAAAMPALARAAPAERARIERRLTLVLLAVAVAGAVAAYGFPSPILAMAFGEAPVEAASAMRGLAAAGAFACLGNVVVSGLVARGKADALFRVSATGLAVRAALDALLVPSLGARGASFAASATEGVVLAAALLARRRADREA